MSASHSDDDYYDMIDAALNDEPASNPWPTYALDLVSDPQEWLRFKAAMARWMAAQEADMQGGFDQYAQETEHDDEK